MFLRQDDKRTDLQQRLADELREKAKKQYELENHPRPDGVDDSQFMKEFTGSSRWLWLWLLIAAALVVAVILFITLP